MAQQPQADCDAEPFEYSLGRWEWDDPDHGGWAKFDAATSAQIEDALKAAISEGASSSEVKVEVHLDRGAYFGKKCNLGVYAVVVILRWATSEGAVPYIEGARQTNIKTKFGRNIRRVPALKKPLDAAQRLKQEQLRGRWEWKDDAGWVHYGVDTMAALERAYSERAPRLDLATDWFASRRGTYHVLFNYLSSPASGSQINGKTKFSRWVRRTPHKSAKKKAQLTQQQLFMTKTNPHFMMMRHYAPLAREDFEDQLDDVVLRQNLKCSICLETFDSKNLIEAQRADDAEALGKVQVAADDDDGAADDDDGGGEEKKEEDDAAEAARRRQNAKRRHRFRFESANKFVDNDTVTALNKCSFGHYFHGGCILRSLETKIECPNCKQAYGAITGSQPEGRLYVMREHTKCSGFDDVATVKLFFEFPTGTQGAEHPNPGQKYFGDVRDVFFPDTREGRKWAMLVRLAFERRLLFHVGRSQTLKADNRIVFGSIHLKTSTSGGTEKHGYPDPNYFENLAKELAVKGITEQCLDDLEDAHKEFIEHGFPKK